MKGLVHVKWHHLVYCLLTLSTFPILLQFLLKFLWYFFLFLINITTTRQVTFRVGTISQSFSETPFKLFRFTFGLSHLKKLSFAQPSAYIASANAKNSKWWIFGPSTRRAKNQNFRNPTNHIPMDPEFYADHYSQKDYTLKSNCKKDINHNVSLYPKTLFGAKTKIFKNWFSLLQNLYKLYLLMNFFFKSGSPGVLIKTLEKVSNIC